MADTTLTKDALAHLRHRPGLSLRLPRAKGRGGGRMVDLRGAWGEARFRLAEASRLTERTVGAFIQACHEQSGPPSLLVTEWVSPAMAKRLDEGGVAYVDTAGNLLVRAPGLHLEVQGRRRPAREGLPPEGRPALTSALKLMFVLLQGREVVQRPYRELARRAGISLGSVGAAVAYLEFLGHIATNGRKRRLIDFEQLHRTWELRYGDPLRFKLGVKRLEPVGEVRLEQVAEVAWKLESKPVLVGGEFAAARMTRTFRPATLTLHSSGDWKEMARELNLIPDPEGRITWVGTIGEAGAWPTDPSLADPLLVRAELLLHRNERHSSAAKMLLEELIRPRWEVSP